MVCFLKRLYHIDSIRSVNWCIFHEIFFRRDPEIAPMEKISLCLDPTFYVSKFGILRFFFFFASVSAFIRQSALLSTVHAWFTYYSWESQSFYSEKNIKIRSTILFTYLKFIFLQYFQFSVFSFSKISCTKKDPCHKVICVIARIDLLFLPTVLLID